MNSRKRKASDDLLPTSRPSKVPRSSHACSKTSPGSLTPVNHYFGSEALSTRWAQLAEEVYQLVGDTTNVMFSTLYKRVGLFLRLPSERDDTHPSQHLTESQDSHSPPSRSPSIVSISPPRQPTPPPDVPPPPPRRRIITTENAVASSSSHQELWPSSSQDTSRLTGLLTPSPSQTSSTSSSTTFAGLHPDISKYPELAAVFEKATRKSPSPARKFKPRRTHIFDRKHKQDVIQDRIKTREEMEKELFELRRLSGYKSDLTSFRSYLHYQEVLERMSRLEALNPSPSLVNLHAPAPLPDLARSRSAPQASDGFIHRALRNAKETLKSKPPPPFSPSLDKLRLERLLKSQEVEDRLRPKKKPLPASLPPQDDAEVDNILRKRGAIAKCVREQVSDRDLARLKPGSWLNDEIINFYGQMILSRSEAASSNTNKENSKGNAKLLDVHYFSTFFWAKLMSEGYEKARLAKWTKKMDIFAKDMILIPINHGNAHWTGAAINFRQKRIESYDSMGMPRPNVYKALRGYLDAEHRNKKKKPFDFTGWEDYFLEDTPQQENGFDCGVFTCQFLESLSRGEDTFPFTQANMTYMRRRMIWEIAHTQLRDDT